MYLPNGLRRSVSSSKDLLLLPEFQISRTLKIHQTSQELAAMVVVLLIASTACFDDRRVLFGKTFREIVELGIKRMGKRFGDFSTTVFIISSVLIRGTLSE